MTPAGSERGALVSASGVQHSDAIRCISTTRDSSSVVTGDYGSRLCLWDCNALGLPVATLRSHSPVNAIDGASLVGGPEVVVGGRDGEVLVFDLRAPEGPVAGMKPATESGRSPECWTVAFGSPGEPSHDDWYSLATTR